MDAGALVLIEAAGQAGDELDNLVRLAHLAGTLHDVRRSEPDHAQRGAEAAELILADCDLEEWEVRAVVVAIRNHEAFKDIEEIEEPADAADLRRPLRRGQVPLGAGQLHPDRLVHDRPHRRAPGRPHRPLRPLHGGHRAYPFHLPHATRGASTGPTS